MILKPFALWNSHLPAFTSLIRNTTKWIISAEIPPQSTPRCQQKEDSTFRVMLQAFLNSCSETKTPVVQVYIKRTVIEVDQRRLTVETKQKKMNKAKA